MIHEFHERSIIGGREPPRCKHCGEWAYDLECEPGVSVSNEEHLCPVLVRQRLEAIEQKLNKIISQLPAETKGQKAE